MRTVDLNCDMGEGCPHDIELMNYVSSVNVACGYHAGDAETMAATVRAAKERNVTVGAHPSFPDRANFGRLNMAISRDTLHSCVTEQVLLLREICTAEGVAMRHVKPHGALYNLSARDRETAATIAQAVRDIDPSLVLFGLSGSESIIEGKRLGLRTASEVFADRTYRSDGALTPRSEPNALISEPQHAAAQSVSMAKDGIVVATDGTHISVTADTICIHGDTPYAVSIASAIPAELLRYNIKIHRLYD